METRELLFLNMRSGNGDKSSNVALYAGDRYPSSTVFVGAFGRSQEGFSTHEHGDSPFERNLGNARQLEKSGTALAGEEEALTSFGSTWWTGEGILYGSRVGGSASASSRSECTWTCLGSEDGDGEEPFPGWQSKYSSPCEEYPLVSTERDEVADATIDGRMGLIGGLERDDFKFNFLRSLVIVPSAAGN